MYNREHRDCFHKIMAGGAPQWIPNYELGCWGQTVQRWLQEGAPSDQIYWNFWQGEPFFKIDRHDYAHLHVWMIPEFAHQVLEEDAEYITARHTNGIVTKALKLQLVPRALNTVRFDYFSFLEDCAGKGGPLYGPEIFERFFRKPYTRIIDALRRGGVKSIWLDCDGDPLPLVPLWMEVGVNCFWPLEQASGMDPRMLRKRFGPQLILAGGIDKMAIAKGRKAIDAELEAKIPPMLAQGGYIPFLDHAIPPDISYADFMYYLERKLKLMGR